MRSNFRNRAQKGHILVGVLILLAISALIIASSLQQTSASARTTLANKVRSRNYYNAEESLGLALSWLRNNSTGMALMFSRANFYTLFDRTTPTVGSNDASIFTVPTKVKVQGTTNSAVLVSNNGLATANFPNSTDTMTGTSFDPDIQFAANSFAKNMVRITLVDAIPLDSTKDYGDPDAGNAAPATDFNPVYRVDAMKSLTGGSHVLGYLFGSLVLDVGVGFYGKNLLDLRQSCDSYISNNGAYTSGNKRANCTVGSNSTLEIHQNEQVYGTARTNGSINTTSPYGGPICSDFISGCPNHGSSCQGASCNVSGLPTYSSWTTYCPTDQGNLTISSNSTLTIPGNAPSQKCWNTVTVNNNRTLTLRSTDYSYYFKTLSLSNNSVVNFSPNPATGTINIYVETITGDTFNGNQVFNINNKPYQLRIHYLGANALTLNGNAAMSAFLVAPYATVNVQGNFTYNGGIKALSLSATGSGDLHYDESGDITTISDVSYKLKDMQQRYR